jgi:hypothetical protein
MVFSRLLTSRRTANGSDASCASRRAWPREYIERKRRAEQLEPLMELTLLRRHKSTCPDRDKGPNFLKCKGRCRLYAYGFENGEKVFFSLKTSDLQRASTRLTEQKAGEPSRQAHKTVADAVQAFLMHKGNKSPETVRKYRRHLGLFSSYCEQNNLRNIDDVTVQALDPYVQANRATRISWNKQVEHLRTFFSYAVARKWCDDNPAREIEFEEIPEGEETVPYTRQEVSCIISACDRIGRRSYERLRARAIVLLLRFTGMRISDVITLKGAYPGRLHREAIPQEQAMASD